MDPAELLYGGDKLIEANHLNGMAAVYEKRLEYQDAQRLYEEALALYEEIFGSHHLTTALVTRNLARVLRIQGKTAEAALLEDHADDIFSRRAEHDEDSATPFGGSSGFFNLLGLDRQEPPVDCEESTADDEQGGYLLGGQFDATPPASATQPDS